MSWDDVKNNWLGPAGALLVFGAVTWGVQLNFAIMNLTAMVAEEKSKTEQIIKELHSVSENNIKMALIMSGLNEDIDDLTDDFDEHLEDSEDWKRKIILNEERIVK